MLTGERRSQVQNYVANSRTGAVVYTPPPPSAVPALMQELVSWLREDSPIHPVLVAGIAQFQLVHVHPFVDGNGRCSRLLSTLCLYRAGYDFKRLFTLTQFTDICPTGPDGIFTSVQLDTLIGIIDGVTAAAGVG